MHVNFVHLCDYATISKEGKLSILGLFSNITAMQFPATHPLMYIVFELELSSAELNTDIQVKVELCDTDGVSMAKAETQFQIGGRVPPGQRPRMPQILPVPTLTFKKPGDYQWSVWLNGQHQRDVVFTLVAGQPGRAPNL